LWRRLARSLPRLHVPVATLAAGLVLLYLLGKFVGRGSAEDQGVIRAATTALAQGKAYRQRLAILQAAAQRAQGRATVAIAADRAKDAEIRRLTTVLALDSTARDSVVTLTQMVDTLTSQRDSARSAVAALLFRSVADSTRSALAEARVAQLEANLRATLSVADCRLLGIGWMPRCPSRTASGLIGLGTGALVMLAVKR